MQATYNSKAKSKWLRGVLPVMPQPHASQYWSTMTSAFDKDGLGDNINKKSNRSATNHMARTPTAGMDTWGPDNGHRLEESWCIEYVFLTIKTTLPQNMGANHKMRTPEWNLNMETHHKIQAPERVHSKRYQSNQLRCPRTGLKPATMLTQGTLAARTS